LLDFNFHGDLVDISSELYEFIVKVVEDKIKNLKVSRAEFDKLIITVNKLADRVNDLALAQMKTEERLNQLALIVDKLVSGINSLRLEVGRLSETIGFGLEDIARTILPNWLYKHLNIEIESLERRFFRIDGEEIEVNLYGVGRRGSVRVVVLGEVKSRIYGRDVEAFYSKLKKLSGVVGVDVIPVMFGYLIHPSAEVKAGELGIFLVASYMK